MHTETWKARHADDTSTAKLGRLRNVLFIIYGTMHAAFVVWLAWVFVAAENLKTSDKLYNLGIELGRELALRVIIQRWVLASIIGAVVLAGVYYLAKWRTKEES